MKTNKTNCTLFIATLLSTLSRDQLRSIATVSNVPRGKDKTDTMKNLTAAVENGTLEFKALCTLQLPAADGKTFKKPVLIKKVRNYKPEKVYLVATVDASAGAPALSS